MNFIGMSIPTDGQKELKTVPIMTENKQPHVTYKLDRPLRRGVREVPAGQPIDWAEVYR